MNNIDKKVLWFEGAGCVERGDVENCRIRTAYRNDEGNEIYLELSSVEVTKNSPFHLKEFVNAGFVDHCYTIKGYDEEIDNIIKRYFAFEYSKKRILRLVNEHTNCSFDEIRVADSFYGYHVHKNGGGYNLMDDHHFDGEKAEAARNAFAKIDEDIRTKLEEKWSKISLLSVNADSITVRCYASGESMRSHGMNPEEREITVKF